jgi:tetratricopeptide (TPR) repeat protein
MWFDASKDNMREALSASRRAVELDPESPVTHASLGLALFLARDYEAARNEFETALGLCNELFEAYYYYGRSCFAQGQFEKAAELFGQASQASPADFQALSLRGLCFRALNREAEAHATFQQSLKKIDNHLQLNPDDVRAVYMKSGSFISLGDHAQGIEWSDRALAMDPEEPSVLYNVACNYALLNETEKALDCIEKAFHKGFGHIEWMEHDPDFLSVKNHPRFKALMRGLAAARAAC